MILKEEIEDSMDVHDVIEGQFIDIKENLTDNIGEGFHEEKNNIELSNKLMASGFQKEEKHVHGCKRHTNIRF